MFETKEKREITNHDRFIILDIVGPSLKKINMSVQRSELYHFSAVDVFLELLKRRICYYTKKVGQSDACDINMIGGNNEKFSLRLIRSKLRKREESSGASRTNVVHPEGVLQATVIETSSDSPKTHRLEDVFVTSPASGSESSLSTSTASSDSSYLPMFLYSTAESRNSLYSDDHQVNMFFPFLLFKKPVIPRPAFRLIVSNRSKRKITTNFVYKIFF